MAKQKTRTKDGEPARGRGGAGDAPEAPGSAAATAPAPASSSAGGYTVLARRYRSREFDELIGQEAVVRTLRNAIAQNRVAHAYLFTGTRGVGKTSAARLLAQELCRHPRLDAAGQAVAEVPAQIEAIGEAILRGNDLDVIEIDAASNTGVDNVRDLIASAGLVPARCPYKVYIIDEVHMLSKSAFNALLKIMEEPPPHVKFILCTTEPQKVPATIQSRCQRFDFRGIPPARIATHLRSVLDREGFAYEEDAVLQVARLAAGSMRDALTLLDRLLAAADGRLDAHLVESMLGLPDASVVNALVDAVAGGDPRGALAQGDELIQRGNTVERAIDALIEHFRGLMLLSVCGAESPLFEGGGDARATAVRQAARFDAVGLVHRIAQCEAAGRAARAASAPRAIFDALLVRLATVDQFVATSTAAATSAEGVAGGGVQKKNADAASSVAASRGNSAEFGQDDARHRPGGRAALPSPEGSAGPTRSTGLPTVRAAVIGTAGAPPPPTPAASASAAADPADRSAHGTASAEPSGPPEDVDSLWSAMQRLASRGVDAAILRAVRPVSFDGRSLRLAHAEDEPALAASVSSQMERLTDLARRAAGRRITVVVDAIAAAAPAAPRGADLDAVRSHPLVREAMQLFDAAVVGAETNRAHGPAPTSPSTEH